MKAAARTTTASSRPVPSRIARWLLATVGIVSVAIGAIGVFVPGLPTTVFLIIATWCFAKSCPWMEDKLVRNRLFAPLLMYVDRTAPIPLRAKVAAISAMWVCVTASIVIVALNDAPWWIPAIIAAAACIGTIVILRWDAGVRKAE